MVSTLSLDGLGKWKLKKMFQKSIVVEKEKFETQSILGCQKNTWECV
jgi:hypothetical protein